MRLRAVLLVVTVWAVAVVVVSLATWQVIHLAGQGVLEGATAQAPANDSPTDSTTESASPTPDSVWRPAQPHPRPPRPSGSPQASDPTTVPSAGPPPSTPVSHPSSGPTRPVPTHSASHPPSPDPGPGTAHPSPTPSATPPPTATPASVVDSWRGEAGVVTVGCEPGRIRLLGASPADGYRLEVEQESDHVQVHFEREQPADEVQVLAHCVDGVPRFEVEQDDRPAPTRPTSPSGEQEDPGPAERP